MNRPDVNSEIVAAEFRHMMAHNLSDVVDEEEQQISRNLINLEMTLENYLYQALQASDPTFTLKSNPLAAFLSFKDHLMWHVNHKFAVVFMTTFEHTLEKATNTCVKEWVLSSGLRFQGKEGDMVGITHSAYPGGLYGKVAGYVPSLQQILVSVTKVDPPITAWANVEDIIKVEIEGRWVEPEAVRPFVGFALPETQ